MGYFDYFILLYFFHEYLFPSNVMFPVMAEKESYARFTSIIDQIFDNVEDLDIMGGIEGEF